MGLTVKLTTMISVKTGGKEQYQLVYSSAELDLDSDFSVKRQLNL